MSRQGGLTEVWWVIAAAIAIVACTAAPAQAGTLSYFPITDDADSGISSAKSYTHALDFGNNSSSGPVATINGVVFDNGSPGTFPIPSGSATVGIGSTNQPNSHPGNGATNVTGSVHNLLNDFVYNTPNAVIEVAGLTIGQTYDLRIYNRQWDAGNRTQNFSFDANGTGAPEATVTLNPDDASQTPPGLDAANRAFAMSYTYTALSPTLTITADRVGSAGTLHLYGLTNEITGSVVAADTHVAKGRLFNTGVGSDGSVLAPGIGDPHYTITTVPAGSPFVPPAPAIVQLNHSAWLANDPVGSPGSSWTSIVPAGTTNIAPGTYVSETAFDLGGWDASTASIQGSVAVDDSLLDVRLNGTSLGISTSGFSSWHDIAIPVGSGFVPGVNKLEFEWRNGGAGPNPCGLRGEFLTTAKLGPRQVVPSLFNTGVDDNGALLPNNSSSIDPHYIITVNPDATGPGAHVEDGSVFPIVTGPWVANSSTSQWIGPRFNTAGSAAGDYTYETTFDLSVFYADTAEISGLWSTDNTGLDILLNGVVVHSGNAGLGALSPFTIPVGSPFIQGINTLEFRLNNSSVGYTGLRVEDLVCVAAVYPEPATLTILGLGALGLLARRRRKRL